MPKQNSLLRDCMLAKIHYNLLLFCSEYRHLIRFNAKEISVILCEKQQTTCCCTYTVALGLVTAQQSSIPGDCLLPSCKMPAAITTVVKLTLYKAERDRNPRANKIFLILGKAWISSTFITSLGYQDKANAPPPLLGWLH